MLKIALEAPGPLDKITQSTQIEHKLIMLKGSCYSSKIICLKTSHSKHSFRNIIWRSVTNRYKQHSILLTQNHSVWLIKHPKGCASSQVLYLVIQNKINISKIFYLVQFDLLFTIYFIKRKTNKIINASFVLVTTQHLDSLTAWTVKGIYLLKHW